jgi:hypothetical protein
MAENKALALKNEQELVRFALNLLISYEITCKGAILEVGSGCRVTPAPQLL